MGAPLFSCAIIFLLAFALDWDPIQANRLGDPPLFPWRLEVGIVGAAGGGDPLHPTFQEINQYCGGIVLGATPARWLDVFVEADALANVPTSAGTTFALYDLVFGTRIYLLESAWVPFVAGGLGGSYNDNGAPQPEIKVLSTRLNFLVYAGIGYRLGLGPDTSLMLEVRFSHWSNAGTAANNPGYDTFLFAAGLLFRT